MYRIQTVVELTGVPSGTLRAWERRYGIPSPSRSAQSWRMYSERDVAQVRRLRALTEEGLSAGKAAERVFAEAEALPAAGVDPFELVVRRILAAVQAFDPDALEAELRRALLLGSAGEVQERVLVRAMHAVGEAYREGSLGVAHEHLASEVLRGVAHDLHRLTQPRRPVGRAVLACVTGEQHVLPLYAIAFQLGERGYRSTLLGASTPPEAVALAVERLRPALVGLSVTVIPDEAESLLGAYAEACEGCRWAVGGAGAEHLRGLVESLGGRVASSLEGLLR